MACWQEWTVCMCRGAAAVCVCVWVSKRGKHRELARQEAREEHCGEIKMKFEKFASHLALSLPCDLMKFMSLYFDRKATSWLLVLKRKNITYFRKHTVRGGTFFLTADAAVSVWETKAAFAGCYEKLLKAKCYTKIENINRFVDGFSASCSVLELLLREWQSLALGSSFRNYFLVVKILFNVSF